MSNSPKFPVPSGIDHVAIKRTSESLTGTRAAQPVRRSGKDLINEAIYPTYQGPGN